MSSELVLLRKISCADIESYHHGFSRKCKRIDADTNHRAVSGTTCSIGESWSRCFGITDGGFPKLSAGRQGFYYFYRYLCRGGWADRRFDWSAGKAPIFVYRPRGRQPLSTWNNLDSANFCPPKKINILILDRAELHFGLSFSHLLFQRCFSTSATIQMLFSATIRLNYQACKIFS